jgi:cellulose synthase operon protein C
VLRSSVSSAVLLATLLTAAAGAASAVQAPHGAPPPPSKNQEATTTTEVPRAVRDPVRLTAGGSNELMGVLGNDETSLYFVSDAAGTADIMRASLQGVPVRVSSGFGDAAWPQISPNGKRVAYISFRSDATGDVCVREVAGDAEEQCLERPDSAELQVLWWDDSSLAVLSRRGLHGDFALERAPLDGGKRQLVRERNMVGLALSPARRWLAYIPVNKAIADVGVTFAQRVAVGIALERIEGPTSAPQAQPIEYVPPLPGVTGSVTFSRDGAFLEFTQFLNDTNRDGAIDGDDNAVIFRVPFAAQSETPIAPGAEPEQLTSARWDCHYPAPARTMLIASCSRTGSLDIYSLPLEGAVPSQWNDERLRGEIAAARDLWTKLLLSARRVTLARDPSVKEAIVLEMIGLHLELGEYESVSYYADNRITTPETRQFAQLFAELARHRRADLALIRGETSAAYVESERARADTLRGVALRTDALPSSSGVSARSAALAALVVSEIQDNIGDKAAALASFEHIDLKAIEEPLLAPIAARRAERLYRLRGDRKSLLEVYRTLAALPALGSALRLEYAERFVKELGRGQSPKVRTTAIAALRPNLDAASELALRLDVESALLSLADTDEDKVRAQLFALYTKTKDPSRRRALALGTLRSAAAAGNEYLQYQFVTTWASSLSRVMPERKYAEALYNTVVLDRAYGAERQHAVPEARAYFYGATLATESLEAHIGFIEARHEELGAGASKDLDTLYAKRFAEEPDSPTAHFVKAYRAARELPFEPNLEVHERRVDTVLAELARVGAARPKEPQVHQLLGFAQHERARRSGSREAAVAANREYLLALDLAQDDERLSASLLHRLGLLQASLGNHAAALRYLLRRTELPMVRPLAELGLRVAIAQSAWHAGDTALARDQMQQASDLVNTHPDLVRYRPLVLDRLALVLAAAGDTRAAHDRYVELKRLLDADPQASPLNRLKANVNLAANALATQEPQAALSALDTTDLLLAQDGAPAPETAWRQSLIDDYQYTPLQYRALVAGLRANAERALGHADAALVAQEQRSTLLEKRLAQSNADEDRLELAQAYANLAQLRYQAKALPAAAHAIERGLDLSDQFNANTGGETNDAELALVQAYAELHLYGRVPLRSLKHDLATRLRRVYAVICKYPSPRRAGQRFLFNAYLAELTLAQPQSQPAAPELP